MSADIQEQYDKIYRYCYMRVKCREIAEDITQETFLRYLENPRYHGKYETLKLLYTIARNLCNDEFRRIKTQPLEEDPSDNADHEDEWNTNIALKESLSHLSEADRELVLMRCINEMPIGVLSELYGISRFALSRRLKRILSILRYDLEKEGEE